MKKSIIMAFALGALSMLSLNVFASDAGDTETKAPVMRDIEINNEDRNMSEYMKEYMQNGNECYNDDEINDGTQRRMGRGC